MQVRLGVPFAVAFVAHILQLPPAEASVLMADDGALQAAVDVQGAVEFEGTTSRLLSDDHAIQAAVDMHGTVEIQGLSSQGSASTLLRRESRSAIEPKVLINIITSPKEKYSQRLATCLHTWAAGLKKEELQIVGVSPSREQQEIARWVPATGCEDNHEVGFACKEATSIASAYEAGTDWLVIVGEDNYVILDNLKNVVATYNHTAPVYLGIPGCGVGTLCEDKAGGMCGGGGEILSRGALMLLLENGRNAFLAEHAQAAQTVTHGWGDISTSCLARRHHVQLTSLSGLYGWHLDSASLQVAVQRQDTRPIIFHYLDTVEMEQLHRMMTQVPSKQDNSASLLQPDDDDSSKRQYIMRSVKIMRSQEWVRQQNNCKYNRKVGDANLC